MIRPTIFTLLLIVIVSISLTTCKESTTQETVVNNETAKRVADLLATMTIADKVGEMTQLSIDMISAGSLYHLEEPHRLDTAKLHKALVEFKVGSIFNAGGHAYSVKHWHEIINTIQDYATKRKKSGIPVLYGIDAIHGGTFTLNSTLFPQQSGLAMTWNPNLAEELAGISAYETRASGIPWSFSPVLDLSRDPRWPRFWEGFGEDVLLASRMGTAMIEGYQGESVSSKYNVAACMKHFLGYSVPQSGKDRAPAYIPERQMREVFLPTFKAAIEAGAKTIMINSGEVNGIPVHANKKILIDLLRSELGFKGIAITDWEDIKYLYTRHRVAKDYKEAIKIAINAGIDMGMVPMDLEYSVLLRELIEEGEIPMTRIDEAVTRILTLKFELGIMEKPYPDKEGYEKFASKEFRDKSYEAAKQSLVLLKNKNDVLPLQTNKKILVTGPTANSMIYLNGGWSYTWRGTDEKYFPKDARTVLEAIDEKGKFVTYVKGAAIDEIKDIEDAVKTAQGCDVIIACLGEIPYTQSIGGMDDLTLSLAQIELVKALAKTGKPLVLILTQGRPRIINAIEPFADAILLAPYPGNEGGRAVAATIFGENNPSGKLAYTYPKYVNSIYTYDHKGTVQTASSYSNSGFQPQFEFGHGLSYTSFEYSDLKLSKSSISKEETLSVSVDVKNTGECAGQEVVQLFITDKVASITPPVKRLRGFEKIKLEPGASKQVNFDIQPSDLSFIGMDLQSTVESGTFRVNIDQLNADFELQ